MGIYVIHILEYKCVTYNQVTMPYCQVVIAMAQRNGLLQRDNALVTRWWSLKLRLPTLLALVEFYFGVSNASRSFFSRC